ncbi:hypothetical protein N665_0009s0006 [Sinapis alba]|nr:hypothetical protein N665_0009s0006 [Sinapis alba]
MVVSHHLFLGVYLLLEAVCYTIAAQCGISFGSCPDVPISHPFRVCLCSALLVHYSVQWYETRVVWEALDLWILVLICDVPMDSFSLGSTLVLVSGMMRISTAICSLFLVFNLALCAVLLCVSSWWQIEETLYDILSGEAG